MLEMEVTAVAPDSETMWSDVVRVCNWVPPLWDLHNYVAVNPFLGFTANPISQAAPIIADGLSAHVLPEMAFYRDRWDQGALGQAELVEAARRLGYDPEELKEILAGQLEVPLRSSRQVPTFAERHDQQYGTDWDDLLSRSVARWCAVHVTQGGTYWGLPPREEQEVNPQSEFARSDEGMGLYISWLEAARVDRSLEITGLRGWRTWALQLPDHPDEAIQAMLTRLPIPPHERTAYLYRLLGGLFGWASYFRRATWQKSGDKLGEVADLLAIRLCCDAAVAELGRPSIPTRIDTGPLVEDESVRLVYQEAIEDGYVRGLLDRIKPPAARSSARPGLQAVFCIDVRSEPLRRHLEAQAEEIETLGFAGFFGVALDWQVDGCASARCPVLLEPGAAFQPTTPPRSTLFPRALNHIKSAPAVSFSFVEALGLAYAARLVGDSVLAIPPRHSGDGRETFALEEDGQGRGLTLQGQADLAAGILKNMGLRTTFARLVLLCGHESQSSNNPHAAGLDCGACGGHGGAINARVAAALLNNPEVRAGLTARGWNVPTDTHFLPAVHNTSTDQVTLLDLEQVPPTHELDVAILQDWFAQATEQVRRERSAALGLGSRPTGILGRLFRRVISRLVSYLTTPRPLSSLAPEAWPGLELHSRAQDWSEVRPEWGLARNAAFIAARRRRTRGVDLEGRTFLHEYDVTTDPDNSILTLILSAPMVVASWINLQYFASTVDNDVFGCGTKTIHNRVGATGVVLGNGGDLRTGLALQSVQAPDGRWFHEPLRLQVIVEAPQERIEQVLGEQPGVKELVDNGWVRLFALDPAGTGATRYVPDLGWQKIATVS